MPTPTDIHSCKSCGQEVFCPADKDHHIDEYQHEDGGYYYSCGTCIEKGDASALGSIIHWCTDMFGMISGKPIITDQDFDKAIKEVFIK